MLILRALFFCSVLFLSPLNSFCQSRVNIQEGEKGSKTEDVQSFSTPGGVSPKNLEFFVKGNLAITCHVS